MYIVVYLSNNSIHWSIPLLINKDVKDPESIVLISNNINDIILTYESDDVIYIMNLNYSKLQELYNTSIE